MLCIRTRPVMAVAAACLALSACSSNGPQAEPVGTQNESSTSTKAAPAPSASHVKTAPGANSSKAISPTTASGDVKLSAIRIDPKLGKPSAEVTITNHSSKLSNYIVDVSITSADGKTKFDAAMVSAQRVSPGQTTKKAAKFTTTQKLPTGAKLTILGIARLVA